MDLPGSCRNASDKKTWRRGCPPDLGPIESQNIHKFPCITIRYEASLSKEILYGSVKSDYTLIVILIVGRTAWRANSKGCQHYRSPN